MQLSLSEAAKIVGKNKSTILRAVQSGRLPAVLIDGQYLIEETALFELYAPVRTGANATGNAPDAPPHELVKLQTENALLREWLDDLKARLDRAEDKERALMAMLTRSDNERQRLLEDKEKPNDALVKKLFGKREG